jgi:HTH-type transcriptional regulator/antitoxin MqsA
MTLSYRGHSITFPMPGWYGRRGEESEHSGADMTASDRALNRLKAEVEGLLPPEEIRRIRRKLRLTQVEAGQILGGGPRAFQKYESADLLPSRAICTALRLLDRDPAALATLRAPTKPRSGPQSTKARTATPPP